VTLGKEISYSADATIHYDKGPWTLDLHGFYADYDNFIDAVPTAEIDADSGFRVFRFLEGGATFYGSEAEVAYEAWSGGGRSFHVEAAADYVHGKTDAGPAARIPPWSVTARGVYEAPQWTATVELHRVGEQDRTADFELPTDGYTLVNASLVLRPIEAQPDLKVFLDGRNLTNEEAREHASFLKDIAPLPGRTFRMGVGYRF
jgi:iron complex outermembrane receptor protein